MKTSLQKKRFCRTIEETERRECFILYLLNRRSRRTRATLRGPVRRRILHLVRPLGFEISDKYLKRAGLDYWHLVDVRVHDSLAEFLAEYPQARMHLFTTKARKTYAQAEYREGDFLVFGKETRGLEEEFLLEHADSCVRIPMRAEARSLNLSNSVAIAVYEGLRQNAFGSLERAGQLHRLHWE